MESSELRNQLQQRNFDFSVGVIKFLRLIKYSKESDILKSQLLRSATSIGANYEEAQGAFSKDDFKYKISICYKESRETNYWLRIFKVVFNRENKDLDLLLRESDELKKMFSSISKKIKLS